MNKGFQAGQIKQGGKKTTNYKMEWQLEMRALSAAVTCSVYLHYKMDWQLETRALSAADPSFSYLDYKIEWQLENRALSAAVTCCSLPGLQDGMTAGDESAFCSCFSCFLYFARRFWNQTLNQKFFCSKNDDLNNIFNVNAFDQYKTRYYVDIFKVCMYLYIMWF